ncbi:PREDICTED: CD48 antigen [Elephantulus edwardii]|uniref:CD48 antigen n=1 Tax=Elephantulus edwardii TaxID=28737 RepID=UPI0003F0B0CA|nr:PREDICTED: CD48 antigen [Elephantulus edwardii]
MNALSGSNVHLNIPTFELKKYKELTWGYGNQKIVEWDLNSKEKPEYFKNINEKKYPLESNGILTICNVTAKDSNTYYLKAVRQNGSEWSYFIRLLVHDPLSKPVIKVKTRKEVKSQESCYVKLLCDTSDESINYTWYRDSGPLPQKLQNNTLEITHYPKNFSKFYTCQVSNSMSNNNDTVYFISPCVLAQSSGVAWIATGLVIMVPVIYTLLLM